jgi:hypothetical protein
MLREEWMTGPTRGTGTLIVSLIGNNMEISRLALRNLLESPILSVKLVLRGAKGKKIFSCWQRSGFGRLSSISQYISRSVAGCV